MKFEIRNPKSETGESRLTRKRMAALRIPSNARLAHQILRISDFELRISTS